MPPTPNVWAIALEYLRIFRHGFKPSTNERTALVLTFLQKFMAPDVSDGYFFGPQALLRNWELFSRCFGDVQVDLNSMASITEDILSATTTTSITISSNTLKLVFPHLNSDGYGGADGGAWSALAKRLEGQRLVMRSTVKFHWDNMNMRVIQMQTRSDMLTAVYHVLGSWEAVNHVFDGAFLTPECTFTSTSEHRYSW
ncbi:hypothetical protein PHMEG_00011248 [Phytophthora megakarya]|uniref:Bzip transcription factor n=1 Tax=Phytophthora megakarya TaxID=4795 RepID=A0A225WBQ6_9STRA|nr:hypothetical protein PHMEG_00011248 [Phytophthora megakarya]